MRIYHVLFEDDEGQRGLALKAQRPEHIYPVLVALAGHLGRPVEMRTPSGTRRWYGHPDDTIRARDGYVLEAVGQARRIRAGEWAANILRWAHGREQLCHRGGR